LQSPLLERKHHQMLLAIMVPGAGTSEQIDTLKAAFPPHAWGNILNGAPDSYELRKRLTLNAINAAKADEKRDLKELAMMAAAISEYPNPSAILEYLGAHCPNMSPHELRQVLSGLAAQLPYVHDSRGTDLQERALNLLQTYLPKAHYLDAHGRNMSPHELRLVLSGLAASLGRLMSPSLQERALKLLQTYLPKAHLSGAIVRPFHWQSVSIGWSRRTISRPFSCSMT
jgi:hypothetical protein